MVKEIFLQKLCENTQNYRKRILTFENVYDIIKTVKV